MSNLLTRTQSNVAKLRGCGLSYSEIAENQEITVERVRGIVKQISSRAIDENRLHMMRQVELNKLDEIEDAYMEPALQLNKDAAGVVFQAMDRRAKLLGLDVKTKKAIELGPQVVFNLNFKGREQGHVTIEGDVIDAN